MEILADNLPIRKLELNAEIKRGTCDIAGGARARGLSFSSFIPQPSDNLMTAVRDILF